MFDPPSLPSARLQMGMAGPQMKRPASAPLKDGRSTAPSLAPRASPEVTTGRSARTEMPEPSRSSPIPSPTERQGRGAAAATAAAQAHRAVRAGRAEAGRRRKYPKRWGARGRCRPPRRSRRCRGSRHSFPEEGGGVGGRHQGQQQEGVGGAVADPEGHKRAESAQDV